MPDSVVETAQPAYSIPDLTQRYFNKEPLSTLAEECGMSTAWLRLAIKRWSYLYSGDNQAYIDLVEQVLVNRMLEKEDQLENASDSVSVARTREELNHTRWVCSRRMPKKFGEKVATSNDTKLTITIARDRPQPVVVEGQQVIEASVSTGNNSERTD